MMRRKWVATWASKEVFCTWVEKQWLRTGIGELGEYRLLLRTCGACRVNSLFWRGPHYPLGIAEAEKLFHREAEETVQFVSQRGCQKGWEEEVVRLSQEANQQSKQILWQSVSWLANLYLITKFSYLLLLTAWSRSTSFWSPRQFLVSNHESKSCGGEKILQ